MNELSFSSEVKEELSKINNLSKKDLVKEELIGYLIACNTSVSKGKTIRYATESEYNINRFSKLLANLQIDHKIEMEGKSFVVTAKIKDVPFVELADGNSLLAKNKDTSIEKISNNEDAKKARIRGAFLGGGSMNNPDSKYHMEISLSNRANLEDIKKILEEFKIKVKKMEKNSKQVLYLKEGEEISKILALMGAGKSVLKFEEIRVQREMRGKVNRLVNCKTANLNKTINASVEQIEAIKKLKEKHEFNKLDDNLKEIARLRLEYPEMPLIELGQKLSKPVGKSGVNYRLKKIIEIAKEI